MSNSVIVLFFFLSSVSTVIKAACNQPIFGDRRGAHGGNVRNIKIATYNAEWIFKWGCTDWAYFTGTAVVSKTWYKTPTSLGITNTTYYTNNNNRVLKRHFIDVSSYIYEVNADIVIIQEVCDCGSLEFLIEKINIQNGGDDFGYKPWIPTNQGNQMKVGYLTRLDPAVSAAYIVGERGFEAQFSLWGTTVYLYGVHFTAGGGNGGKRSRDNDAKALEAVYRGHLPNVIVAGDFNGGITEHYRRQIDFAINNDIAATLSAWHFGGTTISFLDHQSRHLNQDWPLLVHDNQYKVADNSDATELIGKRLSAISYRIRGGGLTTPDFATDVQALAGMNTMCAADVVGQVSITFTADGRGIEVITGNIFAQNGKANTCNAWNHVAGRKVKYKSDAFRRVWTVTTVNGKLEITNDAVPAPNDADPPGRQVENGLPRDHFVIIGIFDNIANVWTTDPANAAVTFTNKLDALYAAMPGAIPNRLQITIARRYQYSRSLVGLMDADTAAVHHPTHYDCMALLGNATKPGHYGRVPPSPAFAPTVDYVFYGNLFATGRVPNLVIGSTQYPRSAGKHCFDINHKPPHHIYSDHDPITVQFNQPEPVPVIYGPVQFNQPAHEVAYGDDVLHEYGHLKYNYVQPINHIYMYQWIIIVFAVLMCLCLSSVFGGITVGCLASYAITKHTNTSSQTQENIV
eukprot:473756_1